MNRIEEIQTRLNELGVSKQWYRETDEEGSEWIRIPSHDLYLGDLENTDNCCYKISDLIIHAPDDIEYLLGEVARLRGLIDRAIRRYDSPEECHNKQGGFPRPQLAWAMYSDLKEAYKEKKNGYS